MIARLRARIEDTPTHLWMARLVVPIFIMQRWTGFVSDAAFDSLMLGYLWWLSEVTAHESWLGRRAAQQSDTGG